VLTQLHGEVVVNKNALTSWSQVDTDNETITVINNYKIKEKEKNYPSNRPWRPIGL
jgi:hypothetical protein